MMPPVYTVTNSLYAMQACVHIASQGGYNVVSQDLDSGEYLPWIKNFVNLEDAKAYADTIDKV